MDKRLARLRRKAMNLPLTPGVYIMHDKTGEIIYIGKAKALKNRVSQYFGSQNSHPVKVQKMVENVEDFDYILTDSEFEALVLECSLIKQNKPKYNILLKDDKGYHYIKITGGEWPKISAEKNVLRDGAEYIGPYTGSYAVTQSVDEALKIFRLPQCSKEFPKDIRKSSRPCLNFFIGQCSAPCAGKISQKEYKEQVDDAVKFLKGGSAADQREIRRKMEEAAENLEFEKAARLRDRIIAIKRINEKQKVVASSIKEQDVFALAEGPHSACFEVFRFIGGKLCDKDEFLIDAVDDAPSARSELLSRYYSMRDRVPARIALDGETADMQLLCDWLSEKAGKRVRITVPQKGEQKELVQMCRSNAQEKLAQLAGRTGREMSALNELAKLLGLSNAPKYIESYDISNTAGSDNVAGMIVFKDGRVYKKGYRKFEIKSFEGQDDYSSMREVLSRRFARYEQEKDSGEGFGRLPDLILLDGGKGQVSAVLPVLQQYGLKIPVFGMVKDDKHRTRAIAANGGEIAINSNRQAFTLVSSIQEEVHRFAVGYHRQKRKKNTLSSELLSIEGIGEERARQLLIYFKTIKAIREATVQQLEGIKGMTKPAAESVYNYFNSENDNTDDDKVKQT